MGAIVKPLLRESGRRSRPARRLPTYLQGSSTERTPGHPELMSLLFRSKSVGSLARREHPLYNGPNSAIFQGRDQLPTQPLYPPRIASQGHFRPSWKGLHLRGESLENDRPTKRPTVTQARPDQTVTFAPSSTYTDE